VVEVRGFPPIHDEAVDGWETKWMGMVRCRPVCTKFYSLFMRSGVFAWHFFPFLPKQKLHA